MTRHDTNEEGTNGLRQRVGGKVVYLLNTISCRQVALNVRTEADKAISILLAHHRC